MKPAAMVASSPGRAEKLPAQSLARLLRGKSGSRSRARASPMFVPGSRSVGRSSSSLEPALAEGGEPSSPIVTCIGQVRVRKKNRNQSSSSTKKNSPKSNRCDPSLRCCRCLDRALLCKFFTRRIKKRPRCCCCRPYRFFFCWKSKQKVVEGEEAAAGEPPPPPPQIEFVREVKVETESEDEDEEEVFVSSSYAGGVNDAPATAHSPPKNALLLMRCRSAPHNRSSAPALCRFPVSPIPGSESEEEEAKGEGIEERGGESCNLSSKEEGEEEESRCSSTSRQQSPAGLMRCKSEPAKKAERLMEVTYSEKLNGSGSGVGGLGMVREVGPTP